MKADDIGHMAYAALISEARATPKPGLVDSANPGAHSDMDIHTFERSARALEPFFVRFAQKGAEDNSLPAEGGLFRMRGLGLEAEKAMFLATCGVNTHKGAIFSLGLLAAAAGRLDARGDELDVEAVCRTAAAFAEGILLELDGLADGTKGAMAFRRHGVTGARGEAAAGFPNVRNIAMKVYDDCMASGASVNDALCHTLVALIARVEDSNILMRGGMEAAVWARMQAAAFLEAYREPAAYGWREALVELDSAFIARNISPGGCADLIACLCFLDSLRRARR